ncbi:hypothetical protein [Streptomyces mirabilis]|uniref:hypothetical protein n=1 Tax=Streptomyces mirabilis TaxID=68239 RepID=UPI0036ACA37C
MHDSNHTSENHALIVNSGGFNITVGIRHASYEPFARPLDLLGRAGHGTADLDTDPHPGWSAALEDGRLTVHRPGGATWFDREIGADRHWRRRVRDHRTLLLVTGPFTSIFDLRPAAEAGRLFLLTTPVRLLGNL